MLLKMTLHGVIAALVIGLAAIGWQASAQDQPYAVVVQKLAGD